MSFLNKHNIRALVLQCLAYRSNVAIEDKEATLALKDFFKRARKRQAGQYFVVHMYFFFKYSLIQFTIKYSCLTALLKSALKVRVAYH